MPTEKISVEPKGSGTGRILNAIEKVRLQKQRPNVERIHRVLRQSDPDLSIADVGLELEKAAKDGVILKVVTNNVCSYKLPPPSASSSTTTTTSSRQKGASLPVLKVLPNREFLDGVVSSVNCLERCSLETLEGQLRRKYALETTGDTSLKQELHSCCRKLVKSGRLRKDGQFFSPSSKGSSDSVESVTESTVWKNPTIHLEDCTSGKAMSSTPLHSSTTKECLKEKTKQRGSDSINRYSFYSGDKAAVTGVRHLEDLCIFPSRSVRKSSQKEREGDTLATWGKSKTPVERTSPQKNSNGKSKASAFYRPTDFNRSLASTGNRKLATCDSTTTSHPALQQVTSTLESQSSTLWRSSPEEEEKKKEVVDDGEKESEDGTEEKPKKRSRSLQLAFLYDSLSKFFTASGSKRAAVQRSAQPSSSGDAAARWVSPAGSMSLRAAVVPKAGYGDRWHSEERKREKFSRTSKSSEKSKSVQMKAKKAKKELCLKQRHFQTKYAGIGGGGGGAGEVFTSQLTKDDSRLFEIAQTTAQEGLLVSRGGLLSDIESRHCRTQVIFGKYEFESTQQIPYLPEYSTLPRIYICEFCLKCFKTKLILERHVGKCGTCCRPPGEEIYHDSAVSVFEVHGSREPVYCRHLVLFGRLFLDHPGLYCRVSQTIYYVVTVGDRNGCHLVGFYSREKLGEHNLACFLVLPQHRGKGFGHFMVHLSYWLSSTDETPKYPRPPLTDAARWIYHSVWKKAITECIELEDLTEITVRVVSCLTGIRDEDVQTMLCELGLMCEDDPRQRVIALTPALREILQIKAEEKTRPIEFNPSAFLDSRLTRKLRGKPRAVKRSSGQPQSKVNLAPAKRQRRSESGEAVDDKPELPSKPVSKWKALDDSATLALPSRRKVGWPKGVKRGPRKEKAPSENETVETRDTSVDISGTESRLDFESSRYGGRSLELEDAAGVSTSARSTRYRESSNSPFGGEEERRLDIGGDEELLSDREGSMISEMPQLDEKDNTWQDGNNDLQFGRSPSPPQLEQEIPSPYFCPAGYMRDGLDMGSKDAQSVLSDCLAGRSVAPSPCFSVDEPQLKSDKRMTDNESDSDMSVTYNSNRQTDYKGQSSRQGSATPCSPLGGIGSNFAASRESSPGGSKDDSLSSTGLLSRSSSVDLPAFAKAESSPPESSGSVKDKLFPAESSPNSNKGKLSSVHSPDSVGGKPSPMSSPDVNRDRSSPVESPKENSPADSPIFVKDKSSSPSSQRAKPLSALPSPEPFQGKLSETKKAEEVATPSSVEDSPSCRGNRSENELPSDPGEDDLPRDHSSVVDLPPSSVLCYSETEERKAESCRSAEQANNAETVVLRESILPPVQPMFQPCVRGQLVNDATKIAASRLAKEVPDAFCGSFANQSPAPSTSSQLGQLPFAGHGSALSHLYAPNGHGAITSPPMSHNSQMVNNNAMSRYEGTEMGRLDVAVRQQQPRQHHPMPKVGPTPKNSLESSPTATSSMARTFSEQVAPQPVLMEAMSPHSFQLQNGLPPARLAKSGGGAANSFSQCNDLSSILAPNSHGTRVSRQTMLANAGAMARGRSVVAASAALSPGYMNSIPSPVAKGAANNFGQSKSSAMMAGRSNAGRQQSSQAAAAATAGNFGHQQMSKQIMSNKYNKAMVSNIQLQQQQQQQQNLSSCGLYGLPKSSPGTGVPQGISNSSPSMNYPAVPNLSPNSGECANVSLHTLSGHNRNLVNASPAPSCSGKQYARNMQHGTSRGFNTGGGGGGGGGGSLSPSPKQHGAGAIYQLHQSQNPALSPHQIQTPAPYMHGTVQRHIGEQFSPAPESFSRHQGYNMLQATYLAKLQQLTNDLGPFQPHHYAMALPTNMSPSPIDMTLPSHASPQRNLTPPNLPAQQRHGTKQQVHRGNGGGGGAQHKGAATASATSASTASGFLPDVPSSDMIARYQLLSGYHVQQPMTCPSFIHQGSPSQIPMQVGVMNVGMHPGQPSANFMPGVQGQPNSAVYAAYGYINGGLASQPFNMHLNDLMRR